MPWQATEAMKERMKERVSFVLEQERRCHAWVNAFAKATMDLRAIEEYPVGR